MDFENKIEQPEGRRIEFKESLPTNADLAKTVIAFANDAGGELFIGIQDEPRKVKGIEENELVGIDNKISNLIHDHCSPIILPEISFLEADGKNIIRVYIHKGDKPPYFHKTKGKEKGTYIRVGSSNRAASLEIIEELERQG